MSRKPDDIIADALRLPVKERAELASRLLDSLDDLSGEENDQLWAEEAERRYADYKVGKIEAVTADEVLTRLRSREIRRKLFLDITDEIGKQLDARGVKDEDIERDFAAFKKRRRR